MIKKIHSVVQERSFRPKRFLPENLWMDIKVKWKVFELTILRMA